MSMNISRLVSEIFKGQWAIEPQEALAQELFLSKLFDKDTNLGSERGNLDVLLAFEDDDDDMPQQAPENNDIPEGSVAIVSMAGTMLKYGTYCSYGTTEIVDRLRSLDSHPNIIGMVFKVDSGGGAVNSIPPFQEFHANRKKVFVSLCDTAASAAYFAVAPSDHIMAENELSSAFGSIGVVANFMDLAPYYEKLGAKVHTIYAPESDYKNLPFENALKGDYKMMQDEVLSPLARQFQEYVKTHRKNLKLDTLGILNGKMFWAKEAVEVGLADSIGNMQKAVEKVRQLAEIKKFMSN
jgi:protease IV